MEDASWFSPLEILAGKNGPPTDRQIKLLSSLEEYISNRINFNQERADFAITNYKETISEITTDVSEKLLKREVWYNKTNMLTIANAFYILSFLLICISWIFQPSIIYNISLSSIIMGMLVHSYAIINRIIIMQRPPVSTLYESIVFVSFIAVLISVIIEFWKKNTSGLFVGSILGSILLFIGYRYAAEGDTLGVLVAVLNSNFWLATHVVTITIGYGVTVVASTLAHLTQIVINKKWKEGVICNSALIAVTIAILTSVVKYSLPFAIMGLAVVLLFKKNKEEPFISKLALLIVGVIGVGCGIGSVIQTIVGVVFILLIVLFTPLKK